MTRLYIGVDFHPHQHTACWCDLTTDEIKTRTLFHPQTDEVIQFYQSLPPSIVGIEATNKGLGLNSCSLTTSIN